MSIEQCAISTIDLPPVHRKYSMAWSQLHGYFSDALAASQKFPQQWPVRKSIPMDGSRVVINDLTDNSPSRNVKASFSVTEHESGLKIVTADLDNHAAGYQIVDGFDVHEVGLRGQVVEEDIPQCREFGLAFDRLHVAAFTISNGEVCDELSELTALALAKTAFTRTLKHVA